VLIQHLNQCDTKSGVKRIHKYPDNTLVINFSVCMFLESWKCSYF